MIPRSVPGNTGKRRASGVSPKGHLEKWPSKPSIAAAGVSRTVTGRALPDAGTSTWGPSNL
ncbi:MAG TPA: hypothetical protein VMS37_35800 [Verrucomicrobiae bacterium]|nr:hypothetical protein [Verrucomicrobiae bacterium]